MAGFWPKEIGFFAREGDGGAVNTSKDSIPSQQRENVKKHGVGKSLPPSPYSSWVSDGEMILLVKGLPCLQEDLEQPFAPVLFSRMKNSLLPQGRAPGFSTLCSSSVLVVCQFIVCALVTFLAVVKDLATTKEGKGRIYLSSSFEGAVHHGRQGVGARARRDSWLGYINRHSWSVKPCIPGSEEVEFCVVHTSLVIAMGPITHIHQHGYNIRTLSPSTK